MNRTQARIALLKYSFLVCAALSVLVGVSIWNTRPADSLSMVPEMLTAVAARVPAALPSMLKEVESVPPPRPSFQVWKVPCLAETSQLKAFETDSGYLRISTSLCDASLQIRDSQLKNVSNGYVATVFNPLPSHLTSDYIPLAAGTNDFQMDLIFHSGEKFHYEWTVDRKVTATN